MSWPNRQVDVDLSNELVEGNDAEEDSERVESTVNDVKEEEGDVPEATEIAEHEAKDKGRRVQGYGRRWSLRKCRL
jgi:murein tripeptide amidase MpaA